MISRGPLEGLDALRSHHLADARHRADALIAEARVAAKEVLERAQAEAAELTRQAREEGQESAEQDTGREWTAGRRRARGIRLAAQRSAYEALRGAAIGAVQVDPRSGDLLRTVADAARRRLGPGATVELAAGEVRATRRTKEVRWALEQAVDESLRGLGPAVLEELWR